MPNEHCLIVHAAGRQLDLLRGEASRKQKENRLIGGPIALKSARASVLKTSGRKRLLRLHATTLAFVAETASPKESRRPVGSGGHSSEGNL